MGKVKRKHRGPFNTSSSLNSSCTSLSASPSASQPISSSSTLSLSSVSSSVSSFSSSSPSLLSSPSPSSSSSSPIWQPSSTITTSVFVDEDSGFGGSELSYTPSKVARFNNLGNSTTSSSTPSTGGHRTNLALATNSSSTSPHHHPSHQQHPPQHAHHHHNPHHGNQYHQGHQHQYGTKAPFARKTLNALPAATNITRFVSPGNGGGGGGVAVAHGGGGSGGANGSLSGNQQNPGNHSLLNSHNHGGNIRNSSTHGRGNNNGPGNGNQNYSTGMNQIQLPVIRKNPNNNQNGQNSCNMNTKLAPCAYPSRSKNGKYELKILSQPEEQHRARYLTEGSRGAIKDKSGHAYPVVKLCGYSRQPVKIQCFIGHDKQIGTPHLFYQASKIAGKNSTSCFIRKVEGASIITMEASPANNMEINVDCIGILKERNVDVEQKLNKYQRTGFGSDAQSVANIKRSTRCRLVFRCEIPETSELLQTVSAPILCTQPLGTPEINKKSIQHCNVNGGVELFIIGKNFLKDAKVIFRNEKWIKVVEPNREYLKSTHLICKIPPYHGHHNGQMQKGNNGNNSFIQQQQSSSSSLHHHNHHHNRHSHHQNSLIQKSSNSNTNSNSNSQQQQQQQSRIDDLIEVSLMVKSGGKCSEPHSFYYHYSNECCPPIPTTPVEDIRANNNNCDDDDNIGENGVDAKMTEIDFKNSMLNSAASSVASSSSSSSSVSNSVVEDYTGNGNVGINLHQMELHHRYNQIVEDEDDDNDNDDDENEGHDEDETQFGKDTDHDNLDEVKQHNHDHLLELSRFESQIVPPMSDMSLSRHRMVTSRKSSDLGIDQMATTQQQSSSVSVTGSVESTNSSSSLICNSNTILTADNSPNGSIFDSTTTNNQSLTATSSPESIQFQMVSVNQPGPLSSVQTIPNLVDHSCLNLSDPSKANESSGLVGHYSPSQPNPLCQLPANSQSSSLVNSVVSYLTGSESVTAAAVALSIKQEELLTNSCHLAQCISNNNELNSIAAQQQQQQQQIDCNSSGPIQANSFGSLMSVNGNGASNPASAVVNCQQMSDNTVHMTYAPNLQIEANNSNNCQVPQPSQQPENNGSNGPTIIELCNQEIAMMKAEVNQTSTTQQQQQQQQQQLLGTADSYLCSYESKQQQQQTLPQPPPMETNQLSTMPQVVTSMDTSQSTVNFADLVVLNEVNNSLKIKPEPVCDLKDPNGNNATSANSISGHLPQLSLSDISNQLSTISSSVSDNNPMVNNGMMPVVDSLQQFANSSIQPTDSHMRPVETVQSLVNSMIVPGNSASSNTNANPTNPGIQTGPNTMLELTSSAGVPMSTSVQFSLSQESKCPIMTTTEYGNMLLANSHMQSQNTSNLIEMTSNDFAVVTNNSVSDLNANILTTSNSILGAAIGSSIASSMTSQTSVPVVSNLECPMATDTGLTPATTNIDSFIQNLTSHSLVSSNNNNNNNNQINNTNSVESVISTPIEAQVAQSTQFLNPSQCSLMTECTPMNESMCLAGNHAVSSVIADHQMVTMAQITQSAVANSSIINSNNANSVLMASSQQLQSAINHQQSSPMITDSAMLIPASTGNDLHLHHAANLMDTSTSAGYLIDCNSAQQQQSSQSTASAGSTSIRSITQHTDHNNTNPTTLPHPFGTESNLMQLMHPAPPTLHPDPLSLTSSPPHPSPTVPPSSLISDSPSNSSPNGQHLQQPNQPPPQHYHQQIGLPPSNPMEIVMGQPDNSNPSIIAQNPIDAQQQQQQQQQPPQQPMVTCPVMPSGPPLTLGATATSSAGGVVVGANPTTVLVAAGAAGVPGSPQLVAQSNNICAMSQMSDAELINFINPATFE